MTTIADWLEKNVTTDKRALSWYTEPECEPRIVKAYRELLSGYEIDTSTILKTTCPVEGALDDEVYRQYCLYCHAESVEWFVEGGNKRCRCGECGQVTYRAIVLDPAISWWLGPDGEYLHHTAGIFVRDTRHRFLFFRRTAFPFALTIPAGHVDRDEKPEHAAVRELREETGIVREGLRLVAHIPIPGDQCRRGSDSHDWHVYLASVPDEIGVRITEQEGESPVWLTLNDARTRSLTFAVRHLIDNLADSLAAD